MESTSVYGIPIYQILEARDLEVCLVNTRHVKIVSGRKTDVSDCQWLQYLHSVGLLQASFRPPGAICAVRAFWRHRGSLVQMAAEHIMHIQKALDQMNLQVHRALTEITGLSGLRILDAILSGERDPLTLARLCHKWVKSRFRRPTGDPCVAEPVMETRMNGSNEAHQAIANCAIASA